MNCECGRRDEELVRREEKACLQSAMLEAADQVDNRGINSLHFTHREKEPGESKSEKKTCEL